MRSRNGACGTRRPPSTRQTEAEILEKLRAIPVRTAILLIAHRLSAVRVADHIVVLEHGQAPEGAPRGADGAAHDSARARPFRTQAAGHHLDDPVPEASRYAFRPHLPLNKGELTMENDRTTAARTAWGAGGVALIVLGGVLIWITQTRAAGLPDELSLMASLAVRGVTFLFLGGGAWCLVRAGK
ncbi:P-loop NTPase family protein [Streptomyces xanthochromogenes]|uniref:ABC transporter ATP-binding protein n=1 Tax=Streptomyces xanthochromogenes TaxID=67384 RepID=A0ABQ3AHA4_9ACTN|nr:hypothetical protein [Streptomyces xanthochromogenes]GGY49680.1 hypothetical protein GCM10010326_49880 [Streptomyces xanthochromogenes]